MCLIQHCAFSPSPLLLLSYLLAIVIIMVVVVGGGYGRVRSGSARQSPLRLIEFLTPFQFICLVTPSRNHLNCPKYLYTY